MRTTTISVALLSLLDFSLAAKQCVRDSCYKGVVGGPASLRRADCSALLRTVIDDEATTTILQPTTVAVATTYEIAPTPKRGRRDAQDEVAFAKITPFPSPDTNTDGSALVRRDKIVVSGSPPAYASACRNVQNYASACLCYGIKANTYRAEPKTATTAFSTVSVTATSTIQQSELDYLRQDGGAFCSSYINYQPSTVIATVPEPSPDFLTTTEFVQTVTVTPGDVTQTVTVSTSIPFIKRRYASIPVAGVLPPIETYVVIYPEKNPADTKETITKHITDGSLAKRTALDNEKRAIQTPASVATWEPAKISAGCSAVATGETTATTTFGISTVYVSTRVIFGTFTQTADAPTTVVTATNTISIAITETAVPITFAGDPNEAAPSDIDDVTYRFDLPFMIGAFGDYSSVAFISTNGVISINAGSNPYQNVALPAPRTGNSAIPDTSICTFWDDLYIWQGKKQGMTYRMNGEKPYRSITFEFFEALALGATQEVHFSATFTENQLGVVLLKYFTVFGDGSSATVGVQRRSTGQSLQFSYNQPDVLPGTFVRFDTDNNLMTSGSL